MAAPLLIIDKAIQKEQEIEIILSPSARHDDISLFIRLCFTIDGGNEQLVMSHIIEKSIRDIVICCNIITNIRLDKKFSIQHSMTNKISYMEFYLEENRDSKKRVLVE